jgi:hypothetical protein
MLLLMLMMMVLVLPPLLPLLLLLVVLVVLVVLVALVVQVLAKAVVRSGLVTMVVPMLEPMLVKRATLLVYKSLHQHPLRQLHPLHQLQALHQLLQALRCTLRRMMRRTMTGATISGTSNVQSWHRSLARS